MKLRLLLAILFVSSLFVITGCSSSDEGAEATDEVAAEETSETATELDPAASESTDEGVASEETSEDSLDSEEVAEDSLDSEEEVAAEEKPATEEVTADLGEGDEVATDEAAAVAQNKEETDELDDLEDADFGEGADETTDVAAAEPPAAAPEAPAAEEPPAPETDVAAMTEEAPVEDAVVADTGTAMERTWIPVKKIKDIPFTKNGILANTVYLARPGEDLATISQKIYGEDRSGELAKVNPNLAGGVKVGDKVYYNSPSRPTDSEKMLTYFEDKGVAAQTYVAKAGDNIRVVSKQLLGDENSWKEVWASNFGVESKDVIPEGTELRYWTSDEGATAPIAEAAPAQPAMPDPALAPPPPPPVVAQMPPPAMPDANMPPPSDQMANGGMPGTVGNEPPPPPVGLKKRPGKDIASAGADKNMKFMMLAGVVVIVGMFIILAARKKSNARKMSINAHTQV